MKGGVLPGRRALTDLPAPKFLIDVVSVDRTILGYDVTAPPTAPRLLFDWRIDLLFAPLCLVLAGTYLAGVRRLDRRWPWQRSAAWLATLYQALGLPWVHSLAADQRLGAWPSARR